MIGLGKAAMGMQPGQSAQIPEAGYSPEGETVRRATPEQQQVYNQFLALAMTLLYDDKFMDTAIKMLKSASKTVQGIANVASTVVVRVYKQGLDQGKDIPDAVLVHAGVEIVGLVIELAQAAGMPPLQKGEEEMVYLQAADMARDMLEKGGMKDGEALAASGKDFDDLINSGKMASIMAEIERVQGGGAETPAQPAPQGGAV